MRAQEPAPLSRPTLATTVAGVAVVAATLACGWAAAVSLPVAVAVGCLLPALILFLVPRWSLPSIALVLFALVPIGYLNSLPRDLGRFFSPALVAMAVYLLRSAVAGGEFRSARRWPVAALVLGLLALGVVGISPLRSVLWVAVFVVAALLPSLTGSRPEPRMARTLTSTWLVLGAGLSLLAVLESALRYNPLARFYYIDQHWSVYRVQTTLGHPLLNGTFFAMTSCFALFLALRYAEHRVAVLGVFVLSGGAAALSGSRSAALALTVALGVGLLLSLFSRRVSAAAKVGGLVLVTLAVAVIPNLSIFTLRSGSAEGAASTAYRDAVVQLALGLVEQRPLFGGGPGTSAELASRAGAALPLESALLGTLVSVGILGALALLGWVAWVARRCLRHGRLESLTGLVAFLVTGSAFPLWESNPASWVLVGLVALLAAQQAPPGTAAAAAHRPAGHRSTPPAQHRPTLVRGTS